MRGNNATYLSIATSTGVPLTDADYWQLVVQDGTSSSSGSGDVPEPVYLAKYVLNGTPSAEAPTTLEDISENGNTMTVNGIATYGENGYLPIVGDNASLYIPAINLSGHTDYTIHIKQAHGEMNGQHRLFQLPANDLHAMLTSASESTSLKLESANESPGFTSPISSASFSPGISRTSIRDLTMDMHVSGDLVTFSMMAEVASGTVATLRSTHTLVGFTSYLAQGIYLGNRTDGTRPLGVALTEFWIQV